MKADFTVASAAVWDNQLMPLADHPEAARIAHLLRRTTFGPFPGQVEGALEEGYDALLERLVDAAPPPLEVPDIDLGDGEEGAFEAFYDLVHQAWRGLLLHPEPSLHNKMTWFWSTHFTTSQEKVDAPMVWWQLQLLHDQAMGDFAEFVERITIDPGMLLYLDGNESVAESPNENYSRELMELFTLGHAAPYTEADVRNGARALAGWYIDWEHLEDVIRSDGVTAEPLQAGFEPDIANHRPVPFLGSQVLDAFDVARTVVAHPACAPFIAGKLFAYFVGHPPSDARREALARAFVTSGHQIRILVAEILTSPEFATAEYARPRYPVEWFPAAAQAAGMPPEDTDLYALEVLGQLPSHPPNVAGWPPGPGWLSASQVMSKASIVTWLEVWGQRPDGDPVEWILDRCSLVTVSEQTRSALRGTADVLGHDEEGLAAALFLLTLSSPEFALA